MEFLLQAPTGQWHRVPAHGYVPTLNVDDLEAIDPRMLDSCSDSLPRPGGASAMQSGARSARPDALPASAPATCSDVPFRPPPTPDGA